MRLRGCNLLSDWNTEEITMPSFQGVFYKREIFFFSQLTFLVVSSPNPRQEKHCYTLRILITPVIAVDSRLHPQFRHTIHKVENKHKGYIWKEYMWKIYFGYCYIAECLSYSSCAYSTILKAITSKMKCQGKLGVKVIFPLPTFFVSLPPVLGERINPLFLPQLCTE